ncbi:GPI-anchored membrane protein [Penicillium digitatum PHI26]|uniref:GPI-anchored membrane protein n=2 Tax=Penicillium digitatum TaxID=36651 RepID=K9GBT1_PEND2|nr:UPF0619 GPI-anchored membrane protein [Penicillium digitatum Pd1]EKV16353.1 UPF0619 GPI-anchored membrane protein [Penicillium digitatum Pd1]EKV18569.1 GPI-anchored membrane protein [Penicillium digitatum PHI26]
MRIHVISLVVLAAAAAGLTVTSPRMGEKIDPDMPLTIKWQAVTTDPETFSIELVNQNVYPPTTTVVAEDIDTSKGSYTVKAKTFTDVDDGKGYQINFCVYPYLVLLFYCFLFNFYPYNIFFYDQFFRKCVYLFHFLSFLSGRILNFVHVYLDIYLEAYPFYFLLSLFYIYTFSVFFHYTNFLYYIHLCYPDHFFFHYHVFHIPYEIPTSSYLDFQIKHSFFHIPFYTHFHYPWLVKGGKRSFRDSILLFTHYIEKTKINCIFRIDLGFNNFLD